ncbi:MAG: UbiA family prenyltransferase [Deltaproteobacteria bacterium]|nr:UbiA family prenyltransferase [Deltaproteobacteria bacterium]
MKGLAAAVRIVADTAIFRIRKREGGNLVTSLTLAAALGLPWLDLGYRLAFGLLLNLFVYVLNDCYDVGLDLEAPGRDHERTRFLAAHRAAGWGAVATLAVLLAAVGALHSLGLLLALGSTVVVIVAYSAALKRRPVVDVLAMGGWGVTMALVGFPLSSVPGWWLAGLLGLLCMVTEVVQVIRDEPSDRAAGLRTTAVVFGPVEAAWLGRVLIALCAAYAVLFLHRWLGLALLLGVAVPLDPVRAPRSWDLLRAVFGLTWLGLLFAFWRSGALDGWLRVAG